MRRSGGVVEGVTGQKASPTWVGRDGRDAGVIVDEPLVSPRYLDLSPDASRLAVVVGLEEGEIWWHDVRGNPPVQLTDEGHNVLPTWRPDGSGVAFASTRNGVRNLFWMGTDDLDQTVRALSVSSNEQFPTSWTPDGQELIFWEDRPETGSDIFALPFNGGMARLLARIIHEGSDIGRKTKISAWYKCC